MKCKITIVEIPTAFGKGGSINRENANLDFLTTACGLTWPPVLLFSKRQFQAQSSQRRPCLVHCSAPAVVDVSSKFLFLRPKVAENISWNFAEFCRKNKSSRWLKRRCQPYVSDTVS